MLKSLVRSDERHAARNRRNIQAAIGEAIGETMPNCINPYHANPRLRCKHADGGNYASGKP